MNKQIFLIGLMSLITMLVKGQVAQTTKTISITKLIAHEKDNRIFIEWAADSGSQSNYWEVQTSIDGKGFSTIALVLGADPGKTTEQYIFKGKIKDQLSKYYRVVYISQSGQEQISDIIELLQQSSSSNNPMTIKNLAPQL